MFGNQKELSFLPKCNPILAVIDQEKESNTLLQNLKLGIEQNKERPFNILSYSSLSELPKKEVKTKTKAPHEKGIINTNWINTITTKRPAVILYVYYVNSSVEPKLEEQKMYQEIEEIRKNDKYVKIVMIIISFGTYHFEIDSVEKQYSIPKLLGKENVRQFNSFNFDLIFKSNDVKQFTRFLMTLARDYYRTLKKNINNLKQNEVINEKKVKYEIKLAILSMLKTKKPNYTNTKHFEAAYQLLPTINVNKYYFGDNNIKLNYCQIKAVADWLYYKIIMISEGNQNKNKKSDRIDKFNNYFNTFSNTKYYEDSTQNEKKNHFYFYEYYWRYLRLENFSSFLDKCPTTLMKSNEFQGFYKMKQIYNVSRLIKQLEQYDDLNLNNVTLEDSKELSIDQIQFANIQYYEKAPIYCYNINPLDVKTIGFNEDIYLKKFIIENSLSYQSLRMLVRDTLVPSTLNCFDKIGVGEFKGINLYLSILNLLNEEQTETNEMLFIDTKNIFYNLTNKLIKFPKVYFHYVTQYTNALVRRMSNQTPGDGVQQNEKKVIFENLIMLGNHRPLTESEEELFYKLLKENEMKECNEHIAVNTVNGEVMNNKLFNFDYQIIGGNNVNRKVLELVEYEFKFSTILKKEPLKFSSVTFFFNTENRDKKYTVFPNELTPDSPVTINYKLIVQNNEKSLSLKGVQFTLESNPNLIFDIKIYNVQEKIILFNHLPQNVLEFKTPSSVKIGENEYYHCECEIIKDPSYDVNIGSFVINFHDITKRKSLLSQSTTMFAKSSTSMKSTLELLSTKGNPSTSMSSFLNESVATPQGNSLTPPLFYKKTETNEISEGLSSLEFKFDNFEEHCKNNSNKISFLIQFPEKGNYVIEYKVSYGIVKKEIEDESIQLNDSKKISFEVVKPFDKKDEISSVQYMNMDSTKYFANNTEIKHNLILSTNLDSNAIIKKITINKSEDIKAKINCPLNKIIENDSLPIKDALLTIMPKTDYIIPFECIFEEENKKSFGSVTVEWTTEGLLQFSDKVLNSNTFAFPIIYTKPFEIDLKYTIGDYKRETNTVEFIVTVTNLSHEFKKTTILLNTKDTHFYVDGFIKQKLKFLPMETKDISVMLSPLTYGNMKLPPFKEMEFSFEKEEKKMYSIYFYPEYLQISP